MKKREMYGCVKCGRMFGGVQIRKCPINNLPVCYYCCRKCDHHTTTPMCGAIGCDLRKEGKV